MISVRDLLKIPVFINSSPLTDDKLLDNIVSNVTVMEVPDTYKWIVPHSLVLTSLYSFQNSKSDRIEVLMRLNEAKCTCIAIKLGYYLEKLESDFIDIANELGIVILEVDKDTAYTDIIYNAMYAIFESKDIQGIISEYFKSIIHKEYEDEASIKEKARRLGFNPETFNCITVTVISEENDEMTKCNFQNFLRDIHEKVLCSSYSQVISLIDKEKYCFLIVKNDELSNTILVNEIIETISQSMYKFSIGIGSNEKGITGVRDSYFNSIDSIKIGKIFEPKAQIFIYDNFKAHIILFQAFEERQYKIVQKINLNDTLVETLYTYYKYNMNTKKASNYLYIHENTMRYRLTKIYEETGYDTNNFLDNIFLFMYVIKVKQLSS